MGESAVHDGFPEEAIRERLGEFWDAQVPGAELAETFPLGPSLDSMTACVVLLDVESILDMSGLPQVLVKKGGYMTRDEFIDDLSASIKAYVLEEKGSTIP